MSGCCLWISSVLAAGVLGCLVSPALGAEGESSGKLEEKARAAVRLWEYKRDEFITTTHVKTEERLDLERLLTRFPNRETETYIGMALLVALNCGRLPEGTGVYLALRRYRCDGAPLGVLSSAAIEEGHLYVLAFVNPADRQRTRGFLLRYVAFWEREQALGEQGMPRGSLDLTLLREIELFLERGGYPPVARQ